MRNSEGEILFLLLTGNVDKLKEIVCTNTKCQKLLDYQDEYGASLLHFAARSSSPYVLEFLIQQCKFDCNIKTVFGNSAAHEAVIAGQLDNVIWLINNANMDSTVGDSEGLNLLHLAVYFNQKDIAEWLLKNTSCTLSDSANNGATSLHFCAIAGNVEFLQTLISNSDNTDINCRMSNGATPLYLACQEGNLLIVKQLMVSFGADIRITTRDCMNCLHAAAQSGNFPLIQWLIKDDAGKNLLKVSNKFGALAIHVAAAAGHVGIVSWMSKILQTLDNDPRQHMPKVLTEGVGGGQPITVNYASTKVETGFLHIPLAMHINRAMQIEENNWSLSNNSESLYNESVLPKSVDYTDNPKFVPQQSYVSVRQIKNISNGSGSQFISTDSGVKNQVSRGIPPPPPMCPPPPPPPEFVPLKPITALRGTTDGGLISSLRQHFMKQKQDAKGQLIDELKKFHTSNRSNLKKTDVRDGVTVQIIPKSDLSRSDSLSKSMEFDNQKDCDGFSPTIPTSLSDMSIKEANSIDYYLSRVPEKFANGRAIPQWQRELKARRLAEENTKSY